MPSTGCRKYRQVHWEREKTEAAEYKVRSVRVKARVHQAHTARIVRAMRSQWPTHTAVGRQDMMAVTLFVSGITAVAWYWSGPSTVVPCSKSGHEPGDVPSAVT